MRELDWLDLIVGGLIAVATYFAIRWVREAPRRRPLTNERLRRITERHPWPDEHFYGDDDLDLHDPRDFH